MLGFTRLLLSEKPLDLKLLQVGTPVATLQINGANMRISEAATISGLGIDTIRYYEKSGIIPPLDRGSDGQRRFSPETVDWLTLLYWLRETGMPLKTMREFAALYRQGDRTIPQRKAVLLAHSDQLAKRRKDLDHCEEILAHKLAIYKVYEETLE